MVISDAHLPFEHKKALLFCKELKKEFSVPDENVFSTGDFDDQYWASSHNKDPDGHHTSNSEIRAVIEKVKEWASIFPKMKMCSSNHTDRYKKRVFEAELPSVILRKTEEILGFPKGWVIKDRFTVFGAKMPFTIEHGESVSGPLAHRELAILNGISTVIGHLHGSAGIAHIKTGQQTLWGANAGCLIDTPSYSFHYGKHSKFKPTIGTLVILEGGRIPVWVPLE